MLSFTKMHGLGNDFVVIDAINQSVELSAEQIRYLADRHFGIGCDQLLLVERSEKQGIDFRYRIFNADGGEVEQCGNGARCFARFVRDKGLCDKNTIRVETRSGDLILMLENDQVEVNMGIPRHDPQQIPLDVDQPGIEYRVTLPADGDPAVADCIVRFGAVSIGNPHAVLRVDSVASAPVEQLGRQLENHPLFPQRANIGFMEIIDRGHIRLRVYERGAAETLACGSGACAAVVIGIEQQRLDQQVQVDLPGGTLHINWPGRGQAVMMSGPAVTVFEGEINL